MVDLVGVPAEFSAIGKALDDFVKAQNSRIADAGVATVQTMCDLTPVWQGETVRNYAAGDEKDPSGAPLPASGTGEPGRTGKMPLGPEPRRGENTSAAVRDAEQALAGMRNDATHFHGVKFANNVAPEKWDLVENGSAPTAERARYPGGITTRAGQIIKDKYGDLFE